MGMAEGLATAARMLLDIGVLSFLALGGLIGFVVGVLPGLGGSLALALCLPFVFGMEPLKAMFFLSGIMGSVSFGGSIPAILINVPGTGVNVATCFDGYPMAQQGQAGKAIGISASASALGAIFGIVVLLALIPVVRNIVMMFGPPEFFSLALFGLAAVSIAVRASPIKGFVSAALGILLSLIGFEDVTGGLRFTFGSQYLWDGIPLVPFFVGLFGISEILFLARRKTISATGIGKITGSKLEGIKELLKHKVCFLRSSVIGVIIGIIPGIGGATSNVVAYLVGMASSKTPEKFGTGFSEGVICSESANNSKDGGALLTTVAFGIPGAAEYAVLLGGFILVGLVPGPSIVLEHMDVVLALVLGLLISGIIASVIGIFAANFMARIATINLSYIIPVVVVLCFLGSLAMRGSVYDIMVAVILGFLGFVLRRGGFPLVPLIIGFMLGSLTETSLLQSLAMSRGSIAIFFTRPASLILLILAASAILVPLLKKKQEA